MTEKFTPEDRLTDQIASVLRSKPHQSARQIAAALAVTRKEVNSRLYTHLGTTFLKQGSDPPTWYLVEDQRIDAVEPESRRSPATVMLSTGLEAMRHRSVAELADLTSKLLGSQGVRFSANGILVEVSLAEMTLSDPYFEFEMSDASTMQVIINTTSVPSNLLSDYEYVFGHLVHCVADAFVFRAVEQASSAMDRSELYRFKSRVLIQLGFRPEDT